VWQKTEGVGSRQLTGAVLQRQHACTARTCVWCPSEATQYVVSFAACHTPHHTSRHRATPCWLNGMHSGAWPPNRCHDADRGPVLLCWVPPYSG